MQQYERDIELKDILIKLLDYKQYLLEKKTSIIFIVAVFFLFSIIFSVLSKDHYTANLTFVVEETGNTAGMSSLTGLASQFGFDIPGSTSSTFSQQNILELLKSRGVVVGALLKKATINRTEDLLIEHYLTINKVREEWKDKNLKGLSYHHALTSIHDSISGMVWEDIIEDNLLVELQSNDANIINLSYVSLNEEFAKYFVENLIYEMSEMYTLHQTAQASHTLDFLQKRADSVFIELQLAEEQFAKIKDINQRIIKASGRLKEIQLMRKVEVLNTMYLEIVKNLELSKLTLLNQTPIINIIDKPILPLGNNKKSIILAGFIAIVLGLFLSVCFFLCKKIFLDALDDVNH